MRSRCWRGGPRRQRSRCSRAAALTTIRTVAETGSTNADMLALARAGAAEGEWLRAERQVAGRGREGRPWVSDAGNLYASTIVRLRTGDPSAATLALVAAVALDEVVAQVLPAPATRTLAIKWPNDLLLAGAKLSGILLERVDEAVVIGVGVNVAHHPALADRRTTCLAEHGATIDAGALLDRLAAMMAAWVHHWHADGLAPIVARWTARAHPAGTQLTVRLPDGDTLHGAFDRLAADGALVLRLAGGEERVIHTADVFLV